MERRTVETLQLGTVVLSILVIPFVIAYAAKGLFPLLMNELPPWFLGLICIGPFCALTISGIGLLVASAIMWTYARIYDAGYIPDEW